LIDIERCLALIISLASSLGHYLDETTLLETLHS